MITLKGIGSESGLWPILIDVFFKYNSRARGSGVNLLIGTPGRVYIYFPERLASPIPALVAPSRSVGELCRWDLHPSLAETARSLRMTVGWARVVAAPCFFRGVYPLRFFRISSLAYVCLAKSL